MVSRGRNAHRDEFFLVRKVDDQVQPGLRCEMNPHLMGDVYVLTFREDSFLFSELSDTCMNDLAPPSEQS
jgi:hypothetical protein